MSQFIMAEANSRIITGEDKIFAINNKAKAMILKEGKQNVANATIGSLLDDEGNLIVLAPVVDVLQSLSPTEYAEYAPINGLPSYLECVKKAVFGEIPVPPYTEAAATPGGTGAIRNTIQNYSRRGDSILTANWYWGPYNTIAQELERKLETYQLFTDDNQHRFNFPAFQEKMTEILARQDRLVLIINTPAHNPTGYRFTNEDWDLVLGAIRKAAEDKTKKITFLVDIAYIDFSLSATEDREFLKKLSGLPENVLPLLAYSMSKSLTMYGLRGGALVCLAPNREIAEEFKLVCSVSNRGSWSNCTRAAMVTMERIYSNPELLEKVTKEREAYSAMLLRRGRAFVKAAKEANLEILPYMAGFFLIVPCKNPDAVGEELQKSGIFVVPFGSRGFRVSVASISEEKCLKLPAKIAEAIRTVNGV